MPYAFSPANGAGRPIIRRAKVVNPYTGATVTEGGPMQPADIPQPGMMPRPMMPPMVGGMGEGGEGRPSVLSAGVQVGRRMPPPLGMFGRGVRQSVQFRAKGGPVTKGDSFIVGEKGPELFVPNDDGKIVSHARLKSVGKRMRKHKKGKSCQKP